MKRTSETKSNTNMKYQALDVARTGNGYKAGIQITHTSHPVCMHEGVSCKCK